MYKAVIFDMDGVLVKTEHLHVEAVKQAFASFNHELDPDDLDSVVARHPRDYIPEFLSKHGWNTSEDDGIREQFSLLYHKLWETEAVAIPEALPVCKHLKEMGVVLSVATNSGQITFHKFEEKYGFKGLFDIVTTGEKLTKKKPDPEIYNVAKQKLSMPDTEILAVEDSGVGVLSAKAAGLTVSAIPTEETAMHDFSKADYKFKNITELLSLFDK